MDEPVADQTTIEHIIPKSKGGSNLLDNLAAACFECNQRRSYEDTMGLPEGSTVGTITFEFLHTNQEKLLEKKAAIPKKTKTSPLELLQSQRDQGLKEINKLNGHIGHQKGEIRRLEEKIRGLEDRSIWGLIVEQWVTEPLSRIRGGLTNLFPFQSRQPNS